MLKWETLSKVKRQFDLMTLNHLEIHQGERTDRNLLLPGFDVKS